MSQWANRLVAELRNHPLFRDAVARIFHTARSHGVGAGIHSWMGVAREASWARDAMNLFIHSADIIAMKETLTREVAALRARLGASRPGDAATPENI